MNPAGTERECNLQPAGGEGEAGGFFQTQSRKHNKAVSYSLAARLHMFTRVWLQPHPDGTVAPGPDLRLTPVARRTPSLWHRSNRVPHRTSATSQLSDTFR